MMAAPTHTFYRLVKNPTVTDDRADYKSNCELAKPRRPDIGETIEEWTGLSVFDSLDGIRRLVSNTRFSARAKWTARIEIPSSQPVEWRKTGPPGHWSLWGSSQLLGTLVAQVVPL